MRYLRSGIHYQVTGDAEVEVGSNTKYAAIHQLGGTIEIPARQVVVRYRSLAGRYCLRTRSTSGRPSGRGPFQHTRSAFPRGRSWGSARRMTGRFGGSFWIGWWGELGSFLGRMRLQTTGWRSIWWTKPRRTTRRGQTNLG